jgi:hypothetical protein
MEAGRLLYAVIDHGKTEQTVLSDHLYSSTGIDEAPLEIIPYRDVAAVVSAFDGKRFEQAGEEHIQAAVLKYQQVNLALLGHGTLLPLRFGCTARNTAQVEEVLKWTCLQLRTVLTRLTGKVELAVQAFWDLPTILRGIAQEKNMLQEHAEVGSEQLSATAQAPLSEQDKIAFGRQLFEAVEAKKEALCATIHAALAPLACDSSDGPRQSQPSPNVQHLFNRSYLVAREQESRFDAVMNELEIAHAGEIAFRYIGPLPAYSFANIELNQGNFEVISQARQTLAVPEQATLEDIKATYRRLAFELHPDRHLGDPQRAQRFQTVTRAYEVLETYCRSVCSVPEGPYSFSRNAVEKTFLMKDNTQGGRV